MSVCTCVIINEEHTIMLTRIEILDVDNRVKQVVEGKLLGLLTDKQYAIISKEPSIRKKLITGEICKLSEVSSILLNEVDTVYRLAINAKIIDGALKGKHLFITDRLEYLTKCLVNKETHIVEVWTEYDTCITMTEEMG